MGIWLEPQLFCTTVGEALVRKYFSETENPEEECEIASFSEEICSIFAANGVPWTNEKLIPLRFQC
ncbi:hypothetical protein [Lysobacter sp. FW306-1B-D06B]|uniref:hypothetical protein n=1 Tax=Lysobacter sp. FW306-1B-D06B TaxID=3140250 RepID=UPI003140B785